MLKLCGKTVLSHVLNRVQACKSIDKTIVATTDKEIDQKIVDEAQSLNAGVYCGSESDVLSRYYEAAKHFDAEVVIRITADCPLIDPDVLTQMYLEFKRIQSTQSTKIYLSNTMLRTYPRGLDVEFFNLSALESAYGKAKQEFEREHVTPYMYQHPDDFLLCDFKSDENLSNYRWTLDTIEDFDFIEVIYSELYQEGKIFSTKEVLDLLRARPKLCELNAHIKQKNI